MLLSKVFFMIYTGFSDKLSKILECILFFPIDYSTVDAREARVSMRYKDRPEYIKTFFSSIDAPIIKLLDGIRRSEKSTVLRMCKNELLACGVEEGATASTLENIVYVELLRREWHPFIAKFGDKEIDFLLGGLI